MSPLLHYLCVLPWVPAIQNYRKTGLESNFTKSFCLSYFHNLFRAELLKSVLKTRIIPKVIIGFYRHFLANGVRTERSMNYSSCYKFVSDPVFENFYTYVLLCPHEDQVEWVTLSRHISFCRITMLLTHSD